MDEIVQLIQHTPYALQTKLPSYAKIFTENSVGNVAFVYKILIKYQTPQRADFTKTSSVGDVQNDTDLDLTGSPLKFSVYSVKCDDTIIGEGPKFWLVEEENHSPLTLQEARRLISKYFLKSQNSESLPLWVVCDGLDQQTTLLFAGHRHKGWYTRTAVRLCGSCSYGSSNMQPALLKKKHFDLLDFDNGQQCTKTEVLCVYNIFESSKHVGGGDPFTVDSNMKVYVELSWNTATLEVPGDGASAVVAVQVNVGHDYSEALSLWQQLDSLQQCARALDMARRSRSPPVFPKKADRKTSVMERLPDLLSSVEYGARMLPQQALPDEMCKLKQVLEEDQRELDLTDRLWLLLIDCKDIQELIDCLEHVFRETQHYRVRPYLRPKNQTSVAKTVTRLMKGEPASTELTGSRALEMIVEMGLEKLVQDYTFLFLTAGFLSLGSVLEGLVTAEKFCSVVSLVRLHATLELLLSVQAHLDLPWLTMDALAKQALDVCSTRIASLEALQAERLVTLRAPVIFQDLCIRLPLHFSSWRLTLTTNGTLQKVTSVFFCSMSFIFPPSIYTPGVSVLTHDGTLLEEQFYCFQLSSWSDKLN